MTTSQELRDAYLATRVSVEVEPNAWASIDEAATRFPAPLFVITPWNPMSQLLSAASNQQRVDQLKSELSALGLNWLPAVGSSPDGKWSEDSLLVLGLDRATALEIGRRFEQHAIFEVSDGLLRVVGCFEE